MKVKQRKSLYSLGIPLAMLFVIIVIAISLSLLRLKSNSSRLTKKSNTNIQPTSQPDPYAGKRIVDAYPNRNILWYNVHLKTDTLSGGEDRDPPFLQPEILPELFDLPMVKVGGGAVHVIEKIVYNTQAGYPYKGEVKDKISYRQYNADIFIAIKGFALDLTKTYQNKIAKATLSYVDPKIIPYLEDKDYCQTDNDCTLRDSFCGYGSFNKYENYGDVWGCESPPYDLETLNANGMPTFMDEQYDEKMQCNVRAKYMGAVCVNRQCKGTGRTLNCVSN